MNLFLLKFSLFRLGIVLMLCINTFGFIRTDSLEKLLEDKFRSVHALKNDKS